MLLPVGEGRLLDVAEADDAGHVRHYVDAAVALDRRLHEGGHRRRVADVSAQHALAVAGEVDADDVRALPLEELGGGGADARGGPGDEDDPAGESGHGTPSR